jgi:SAM-dependent methyltransferase
MSPPHVHGSFDEFAADYARLLDDPLRRSFAGDSDFFILQKCRALRRHLESGHRRSGRMRILDAGCGPGTALSLMRGAHQVIGSDVSLAMLGQAVREGPVVAQEPFDLPFRTGAFDAAFAFCVYHHLETSERVRHLRELARVVRRGGQVFVFEHNPLNPVTRLVFTRAPVDRGCRMIPRRELAGLFREAGLRDVKHGYVMFVPQALDRPLGALERYLEWLPLGGQYFVSGRLG